VKEYSVFAANYVWPVKSLGEEMLAWSPPGAGSGVQ